MTIPRYICLGLLLVHTFGLWGCIPEGFKKEKNEMIVNPANDVQSSNYSMVPQTLEPARKSQSTELDSPELIVALPAPEESRAKDSTSQQAIASTTPSTGAQSTKRTSTTLEGKVFGEFLGVKTKWEEMKQQLADQLKEQEQKTNALKVKLQLIEQIAEHVNFTTKAYVVQQNVFLAEFSIENRTPYAIKDISITCDQIAPTGTIIQSHAETIYDIINPTTRSTYSPIPFGTKHRQTQSLQCQITNFTVHNP